jgi:hypothetical protein
VRASKKRNQLELEDAPQICSGNKFGADSTERLPQICSGNNFGVDLRERPPKFVPGTNSVDSMERPPDLFREQLWCRLEGETT